MQTVTDEICRQVRSRILDGRHAGGAFLTEAGIAGELDASRAAVREAMARLDREGWVELTPLRGARVVDWTAVDRDEVSELRALLESQAVRRAAGRITASRLERLERVVAESERLLEAGEPATERMAELNLEFHQLIIAAAGSQRLQRLLDDVMDGAVSSRSTYHLPADKLEETTRHHRCVLDAIAHGDAEAAAECMHTHITMVYNAQAD